ncbi:hypothetical protein Csa_012963 [Cucumis sativus]|uniref:Uncharacterized protein n=1 Tax=Cucumis sativus TaxID=3659 RepID=A0A0A0L0S4_CUCSA|nr:hypothetical protein Csa_012963 [Cucumis sativus]
MGFNLEWAYGGGEAHMGMRRKGIAEKRKGKSQITFYLSRNPQHLVVSNEEMPGVEPEDDVVYLGATVNGPKRTRERDER